MPSPRIPGLYETVVYSAFAGRVREGEELSLPLNVLLFSLSTIRSAPVESGRLLNRTATIWRGSHDPRRGEYAGLTPFVL